MIRPMIRPTSVWPVLIILLAAPLAADDKLDRKLERSREVFERLLDSPDREIPESLLENECGQSRTLPLGSARRRRAQDLCDLARHACQRQRRSRVGHRETESSDESPLALYLPQRDRDALVCHNLH